MLDYYVFAEEFGRERLNKFVKEAEENHKQREFLKAHPDQGISSKISTFIGEVLGRGKQSDSSRNQSQPLQKERI